MPVSAALPPLLDAVGRVVAQCPAAALLGACRELLRQADEALREAHRAGAGGRAVAQGRADFFDALLAALYQRAARQWEAEHGPVPCAAALAAQGGYGRAELCPHSDIDLLFIFPDDAPADCLRPWQQALGDVILYVLWDLKLKVGHAMRTVRETIAEARRNNHSKNSMLDARWLAGSPELFAEFEQAFLAYAREEEPDAYIQLRLDEQRDRRQRHGSTIFLQEPEVKNGVGGLRDYQNAFWMARIKLGLHTPAELREAAWLRPREYDEFTSAYDFLLRVRHEIHWDAGRPNDRLDLELQARAARVLGFRATDSRREVEAFMRAYYTHARNIYRISRILEQRMALGQGNTVSFNALLEARFWSKPVAVDGFILAGGKLATANPEIFREDPLRLLRVFRHAQQYEAEIDFELAGLIHDSAVLLQPEHRLSASGNRTLASLLQAPRNVFGVLQQMHELGVLGRFVPEFDGLTCLIQHEFYHRYTADVHTLNCLDELDQIFAAEGGEAQKYRFALEETEAPELLYLMLLLHDIGKSGGIRGHAERGAEQAAPLLRRLGYGPRVAGRVLAIIRQHLEMARFWQHYDVDDPRTARSFADLVGDAEQLRYLFVLTYCDARATARGLWNSYKDMLHAQLYRHTLEELAGRAHPEPQPAPPMLSPERIRAQLPGVSDEEIEAHYNLLPERYFIHTTEAEVALHLRMVNQLLERISEADSMGALVPVIDWQDDLDLSMTVVNVVTWDRAGLFFKLAGAFSVAGLNIISSRAMSRKDHITIDTFHVTEPGGGVIQNARAREVFEDRLKAVMLHNRDLWPEIQEQARKLARPAWLQPARKHRAPVLANVEVYHEVALKRIIVEVQVSDRIGLLYVVGRTICDHGFDITFARISTERGVAVDTFHIEPIHRQSPMSDDRLARLKHALEDLLGERPLAKTAT